jgi:hypothetical protein
MSPDEGIVPSGLVRVCVAVDAVPGEMRGVGVKLPKSIGSSSVTTSAPLTVVPVDAAGSFRSMKALGTASPWEKKLSHASAISDHCSASVWPRSLPLMFPARRSSKRSP